MSKAPRTKGLVGATLIECVVATVVMAVAIPPLVGLFREVAAHEADRTLRSVGVQYADALMEEITSKAFEDPDETPGSFGTEELVRRAYDDIDDFDGLIESPPRRLDGTSLADYGGLTQRVVVANVDPAAPDALVPASDGSTRLKRITVTVQWPGGEITLGTLRTRQARASAPIDELGSAAAATDDNGRRLRIPLINISGSDLILSTLSVRAGSPTSALRRVHLAGNRIVDPRRPLALPTGLLDLRRVRLAERTIPASQSPSFELEFDTNPVGTVVYTLVLNFTEGSTATIVLSVDW